VSLVEECMTLEQKLCHCQWDEKFAEDASDFESQASFEFEFSR